MTKLITISLRWLRRDKKRTLLSFFSVMLAMYLMCFLGIYFSSAVSMLRSYEGYSQGRYHVMIDCESFEQAEKLAHNTAVSESAYVGKAEGIFYSKYISDYREKCARGEYLFPRLLINGRNDIEALGAAYNGTMLSGDLWSLSGSSGHETNGRFPENGNEITVTAEMANVYGLKPGSELTLKYEICKGRLLCAHRREALADDPYHDLDAMSAEEAQQRFDEISGDELREDTEGVLDRSDIWYYSAKLVSALEQMSGRGYMFTVTDESYEYQDIYLVRSEISDEAVETYEKTYTVAGVTKSNSGNGFYFSPDDSWAAQFINVGMVVSYSRIREGLDIDREAAQMCESVGLIADGIDENGILVKNLSTNDNLIFLEGRDLSRASNIVVLILLATVIVVVFVFFARLIVNNAFELSSAYRAEQYGALKTIGTSNRQIFVMIMTECLFYIVTALPPALGLALLTGKAIMSKIMDIKIFDIKFGEGVTEKFFSLEIIPGIMAVIILVAVFSIVMSGYACAIRIKKLSPIEAFKGVKNKARPRRSSWLTRRLFGFPAGYAARNAFRNKMHGGITVLAAIVSGSLIITIGSVIYGIDKANLIDRGISFDFEVIVSRDEINAKGSTLAGEYQRIAESGLFTKVEPYAERVILTKGKEASDVLLSSVTDEYKAHLQKIKGDLSNVGIVVSAVTKEQFETVTTDVSWDDFLSSDGVLLIGSAGHLNNMKIFKDGLTEITVPVSGGRIVLPAAGYCELGSSSEIYEVQEMMTALIPLERADQFFAGIDEACSSLGTEAFVFDLLAVEGKEYKARSFLKSNFQNLHSNIENSMTQKRLAQAIRLAGLSLATVIFAAALINIVSTSAESIVNRRRELSMLRACGMSLRQVTVSLAAESVFYSLITSLFSALLGGFASKRLLWLLVPDDLELSGFSIVSLLIVFVLIFLLMFASYLPTLTGMSRKPISQDMIVKS